jgi:putative hydrolase of the HAD superfamily
MIRGVVFDLGSTLLRFEGDQTQEILHGYQALHAFISAADYPFDTDEFINSFRELLDLAHEQRLITNIERPTYELFHEIMTQYGFVDIDPSFVDQATAVFYKPSEDHWKPMPGMQELLQFLGSQDWRLAIITNAGDSSNVRRLLNNNALIGPFDPVLISADEGVRKPDSRLFQKILDQWKIDPDAVVMIGDTLKEDILGAKQMGLRQIWLKAQVDTPENRKLAETIEPDHIADTLGEIPALILGMTNQITG